MLWWIVLPLILLMHEDFKLEDIFEESILLKLMLKFLHEESLSEQSVAESHSPLLEISVCC